MHINETGALTRTTQVAIKMQSSDMIREAISMQWFRSIARIRYSNHNDRNIFLETASVDHEVARCKISYAINREQAAVG